MNAKPEKTDDLDILNLAIEAVTAEIGIEIQVDKTEHRIHAKKTDQRIHKTINIVDAIVTIGPKKKPVFVEIKRHAQNTNIGTIIDMVQRYPGQTMFVADYINPNMAVKLKQADIQFMDAVGNAYINFDQTFVLITGKKQNKELTKDIRTQAKRAFEPKGLVVTYAFLTDPPLLNQPYRKIAAATGVALGTVAWTINALKAGGHIEDGIKTKERRITNYEKLLDRWVAAWPEKLKPKLFIGTFTADDPYWWKNVNIQNYQAYWGGETAAAKYTKYLKPGTATVFIPANKQTELIRDMRLRKVDDTFHDQNNLVTLYKPFWHTPNEEIDKLNKTDIHKTERIADNQTVHYAMAKPGLVNPILVYADLIATGDTRNIETARIIYDERIARPNG